jgi:hypothetical protein
MLKVIFLIDCDFCRAPLQDAASCADTNQSAWADCGEQMIQSVQMHGWRHDKDSNVFMCSDCLNQFVRTSVSPLLQS